MRSVASRRLSTKNGLDSNSSNYDYSDYFQITGGGPVTEPTSSTVWMLGQHNVTISWNTLGMGGTADIWLDKGSTPLIQIANDTSNDGSYTTWDVPTTLTPDNDYRVKIIWNQSSSYHYSQYFTISASEFGNARADVISQGQVEITWDTGDLGGTVALVLFVPGGVWVEYGTIVSQTANDGTYLWSIQPAPSLPHVLAVEVEHQSGASSMSNVFNREVYLVEPEATTVWYLGQEQVGIRWTQDTPPGNPASVQLRLLLEDTEVCTIAQAIPDTGAFTWEVPTEMAPSDRYSVLLMVSHQYATPPPYRDWSTYFSIMEPSGAGDRPVRSGDLDLQVFPIPTTDRLTLRLTAPARDEVRVRMLDLAGRDVLALGDAEIGPGVRTLSLGTSGEGLIAPGVYFLRAETAKHGSCTRAVLIRR